MRTLRPLLIASAVTLAATAHAQTSLALSTQVPSVPVTGAHAGFAHEEREFVANAFRAGGAELYAARLTLARSSDAGARMYARRMLDDHKWLNDRLRKIAQAKGLQVPPELSAGHEAKLNELSAVDGREFHRRYADDFAVQAHHSTIELFERAAAQVRDAHLKAFVREALPVLHAHLRMGLALQARFEPRPARAPAILSPVADPSSATAPIAAKNENARDALQEINEAVQVVQRMKRDPDMAPLLLQAKGVFIVTGHGRIGPGIGVPGGEGVLVTRRGERFGDPVFYKLAGICIGPQADGAGGEIAMLLMTDRAVHKFRSSRQFSQADHGLTLADYSRRAQVSTGEVQDVIVWSAAMGDCGRIAAASAHVNVDDAANRAYYRRDTATPSQILGGSIMNPHSNVLDLVLRA